MTTLQQQIKLAAQLYEARDAAKTVLGDRYGKVVAEIGAGLTRVAERSNKSALSVAINAARGTSGMDTIIILAAAVELAEPSEVSP